MATFTPATILPGRQAGASPVARLIQAGDEQIFRQMQAARQATQAAFDNRFRQLALESQERREKLREARAMRQEKRADRSFFEQVRQFDIGQAASESRFARELRSRERNQAAGRALEQQRINLAKGRLELEADNAQRSREMLGERVNSLLGGGGSAGVPSTIQEFEDTLREAQIVIPKAADAGQALEIDQTLARLKGNISERKSQAEGLLKDTGSPVIAEVVARLSTLEEEANRTLSIQSKDNLLKHGIQTGSSLRRFGGQQGLDLTAEKRQAEAFLEQSKTDLLDLNQQLAAANENSPADVISGLMGRIKSKEMEIQRTELDIANIDSNIARSRVPAPPAGGSSSSVDPDPDDVFNLLGL